MPNNIILIGPMGSGKSTIGQLIANQLKREFFDSDHYIEAKTGVDIARIFDVEGEEGFRRRETQALAELCQLDSIVLATGGGSVMREENRELLKHGGYIVFLNTSPYQQYERLKRDRKRPLLQTENPRQRLIDLFEVRKPLYLALANLNLRTDGKNARRLSHEIIKNIKKHD